MICKTFSRSPIPAKLIGSAEIVRLAEHDGDLLHWYYDSGLVPGTSVELSTTDGETYTVKRDGSEVALGEKAASGLFVRAA